MVAFFILAIGTVAVLAFVALSASSSATVSETSARLDVQRKLELAANAIYGRGKTGPDGLYYLPAGASNGPGQGYGLPHDLGAIAQAQPGQRIVYCPFGSSEATGTPAVVENANGSSYTVGLLQEGNVSIVASGRPTYPALVGQPDLIGYLIAGRTKMSAVPSCNQVIYNRQHRRFDAPDALVRPIYREAGLGEVRDQQTHKIVYYVAPGASGTGQSAADPARLDVALRFFRSRAPSDMKIVLAPGSYSLGNQHLAMDGTAGTNASLILESASPALHQVSIAHVGGGRVEIPGDLTLKGVDFDAGSKISVRSGRRLIMVNSTIGSIEAAGGKAIFHGHNTLSTDSWWAAEAKAGGRLQVYSGRVFIPAAPYGFMVRLGSTMEAESAAFQFSGGALTYAFYVDPGGSLNLALSAVYLPPANTYTFHIRGDVMLYGLYAEYAGQAQMFAVLKDGGRLHLDAGNIGVGVAPRYGVADFGGEGVSGAAETRIFAELFCWSGELFSESAVGTTGVRSNVSADPALPPVSATPTKAETEAYIAATTTRARRAGLRPRNTTNWLCNV